MTARKKRSRRAAVWIDWTPDYAALFTVVSEDWTPPARVKLQGTRERFTVTARFETPSGGTPTAFVRLKKGDAGYEVIERGVHIHFTSRGAR